MMSSLIVFDVFGETLNERVDISALEKYTKGIPGVYDTFQTPRLNQKIMFDKLIEIKQNGGKECKQRRHRARGTLTRSFTSKQNTKP